MTVRPDGRIAQRNWYGIWRRYTKDWYQQEWTTAASWACALIQNYALSCASEKENPYNIYLLDTLF